jgi:hypothetical protein
MTIENAAAREAARYPGAWFGMAEAARHFPSSRGGRPKHPSSITRLILDGTKLTDGSRLRLYGRRFPGGWATCQAAIDEFVDRLTADRMGEPPAPAPRTPARRARELARTDRELEAMGIR